MGAALGIGMGISALTDLWGASNQDKANQQNYAAQQAQQQMMQQYINAALQGGQNQYAGQINSFLGMGSPQGIPQQYGGYGQQPAGANQFAQAQQFNPLVSQAQTLGLNGGNGYSPDQLKMMKLMGITPDPRVAALGQQTAQTQQMPVSQVQSQASSPYRMSAQGMTANTNLIPSGMSQSPGDLSGMPYNPALSGQMPVSTVAPQGGQQQMYQYQNPGAFTAQANTLGAAPQVQGSQLGAMPQLQASQIGGLPQLQASQIGDFQQLNAGQSQAQQVGGLPQLQAQQVGGLPQIGAQQVAATGTQGFNAGQDGLMQLMNKQIQPSTDPTMNLNLQSIANGQTFDNSDLFKQLGVQDQAGIDQQVGQLHASAGSLGERFGTAMNQNEGQLRGNIQNSINARNAQIQQSSFETSQQNRLNALGQMGQLSTANGQLALGSAGLNLNAAQGLGSLGLQGSAQDLQAQTVNAGNSLQAQQANLSAGLQSQQANQSAGLQAGQTNLQAQLQAALANQSTGLAAQQSNNQLGLSAQQGNLQAQMQAQLANQQYGMQAQQGNLQAQLQAQMANQQYGMQAQQGNQNMAMQSGLANQQNSLQAALANQQMLGQYGINNANILNQNSQFNAGQYTNNSQFAAQQGNTYNSYMLNALMGADNMQQSQNSYNAQLIGMLGGVGVPSAQTSQLPGAIGNGASMLGILPSLSSMMGQPNAASYTPYTLPQTQIGSFQPNIGFGTY